MEKLERNNKQLIKMAAFYIFINLVMLFFGLP